jgi:uncharacterized membrane protein YvbJ
MRCTKYGVNNDEDANYCINCGNNLSEIASKDTTKKRIPKHIKKIMYTGWLTFFLLFINFFPLKYICILCIVL